MRKILVIFLMGLFLVTFVVMNTVLIGRIIPNNDIAKEMAKAPENSPVITETLDGWALPVKTIGPCPPNKHCL